MKPKLPRELLWNNITLSILVEKPLIREIYDIWAEQYTGTKYGVHYGGRFMNEAFYQCTKAVYDNSPKVDVEQLELDIKANVGLRAHAREVIKLMYAILMVRENNTKEIDEFRDHLDIINLVTSDKKYKDFIKAAQKRSGKHEIILRPRPCSVDRLKEKGIYWKEVTHNFNLEAISLVVGLWDSPADKLKVVDMIEEAFSISMSETSKEISPYVPNLKVIAKLDLADLKNDIKRSKFGMFAAEDYTEDYNLKSHLEEKDDEIRSLKASNAKMQTIIEQLKSENNSKKEKEKQERSFTLTRILDYCEKHTTSTTGPVIIHMLNLFLRDSGNSTAEERNKVDTTEYKILHAEKGDSVQGNKTSFGSNSNMVNFNLPDNTDYDKLFAAMPEELKRLMYRNLLLNGNG